MEPFALTLKPKDGKPTAYASTGTPPASHARRRAREGVTEVRQGMANQGLAQRPFDRLRAGAQARQQSLVNTLRQSAVENPRRAGSPLTGCRGRFVTSSSLSPTRRLAALLRVFCRGLVVFAMAASGYRLWPAGFPPPVPLPGWSMELIAQAPQLKHPSVVCVAPDGRVFVAEPNGYQFQNRQRSGRAHCLPASGRTNDGVCRKLFAVFGMQYLEGKLVRAAQPEIQCVSG